MRRSSTGSNAWTAPPAPRSTSTSLAATSAAGAESAHARCHAQLMNGDGNSARASTASQTAGPSARASDSDIRVTPTCDVACVRSELRASPQRAANPVANDGPSTSGSSRSNGVRWVGRLEPGTSWPPPVPRVGLCARGTPPSPPAESVRPRTPCRTCCSEATPPAVAGRARPWRHSCSRSLGSGALERPDMCGIAGIVYRERERPVSESRVRRMCAALRHRGPDDEGFYVHGPVGLGMRRLSIIDLSGGQQPSLHEDASKLLVFNGEIYNYQDLRRGLVARGHTIRARSDTETVLHLYEELGAGCVTPLRGMFAFAIWDASAETLLLARDRLGIDPLSVVTAPRGIPFAPA